MMCEIPAEEASFSPLMNRRLIGIRLSWKLIRPPSVTYFANDMSKKRKLSMLLRYVNTLSVTAMGKLEN
jgi:hypothetical protein